jgi:hypothetical protein
VETLEKTCCVLLETRDVRTLGERGLFLYFFLRMYPSILSFETINKLKLSFECGIPRMPLFHNKRRSGRDRESNPAHLLGRQRL